MKQGLMVDKVKKQTLKFVIAGPSGAGKTTFIDSIAIRFTELDHPSRDWRFAPHGGWLDLQEALIYLLVPPGSRWFDFMWEALAEGMIGFIVMVDSCNPETFRKAGSIANVTMAYAPVPCVIAANFSQRSTAWDAEGLRVGMQLEKEIPIVPCDATSQESVKKVLLRLLEEVFKDSGGTSDMVRQEV